MKNEHPAFFPLERALHNSLNYEGIAVIELRFYFPDSDRLRVSTYELNSLND